MYRRAEVPAVLTCCPDRLRMGEVSNLMFCADASPLCISLNRVRVSIVNMKRFICALSEMVLVYAECKPTSAVRESPDFGKTIRTARQ